MSGGSYNYLAFASDLEDLLSKRRDMEAMADRLDGLSEREFPGSTAAARMTRELLLRIQTWESHAAASASILSGVWKGVEWWDSCDWGEDEVRAVLATYEAGE